MKKEKIMGFMMWPGISWIYVGHMRILQYESDSPGLAFSDKVN